MNEPVHDTTNWIVTFIPFWEKEKRITEYPPMSFKRACYIAAQFQREKLVDPRTKPHIQVKPRIVAPLMSTGGADGQS